MIIAALLLAVAAGRADGQGSVRGVVVDSTRGGAPMRGALVQLLGHGRSVATDSAGRFEFRDLAPGRYTVAHWSPALERLGLIELRDSASLTAKGADARVTLAIPSLRTVQRMHCGTALPAGRGLVLGELRDTRGAPVHGVQVVAMWTDLGVEAKEVRQRPFASVDTTRDGRFALCDLPIGEIVRLLAGRGEIATGTIMHTVADTVERLELVAGDRARRLRVLGTVVDQSNRALAGAPIRIADDTADAVVRTDSLGRFELLVPRRSFTLELRALGYAPLERRVDPHVAPDATEYDLGAIGLGIARTELATVNVRADYFERERAAYEKRRQGPIGFFVGDEQIARLPVLTANAVASFIPRTAVDRGRILVRRGPDFCAPRYFIDGADHGRMDHPDGAQEVQFWLERAKRLEVYTAQNTHLQFNDFNGCGAVVIWTR